MSCFNNNSPNVDPFLLQTLMDRLQLRNPVHNPLVTQSLEDFLFTDLHNDNDDVDDDDDDNFVGLNDTRSELVKEEAKLEREIIKLILTGKGDSLKPNSGQAVAVRDHHICVGYNEDEESNYRVWEWHGHIMAFDEEYGYSPEYIYGNYFQRMKPGDVVGGGVKVEEEKGVEEKDDEKVGIMGLRELIDKKDSVDNKDSSAGRILHRNMNAGGSSKY